MKPLTGISIIVVIGMILGLVCTFLYVQLNAKGSWEMTQAESIELVHALDAAQIAQNQAQLTAQTYNQTMERIRKTHGWPDDLVFDGATWKHAPKPAEPTKEEPKK